MKNKSCFVIMPIGDQYLDGNLVSSSSDLKEKYDHLIKEAILKAKPNIDVFRADEIPLPGTITTDIITRIMHSDYVIVDVTYSNPNVFYELGLRHACRTGTVILKDKNGPKVPFDIAHLRYFEYENTPLGINKLADHLKRYFEYHERDPERPDNQLLELAKLTSYEFIDYRKPPEISPEEQAISGVLESPELIDLIMRRNSGEDVNEQDMIKAFINSPNASQPFIKAMVKSGQFSFSQNNNSPKKRSRSKSRKKR